MIFSRLGSSWLLAGSLALMLLLAAAAVQQYRWINRVSEADRRQRREYMETTLRSTSNDFRETILDLLPSFRPSPTVSPGTVLETYLKARASQWRETSYHPQLLSSISFATETSDGVKFKRLSLRDEHFTESAWPEALQLYRTILENHLRMPGGEPPLFPNGFAFQLSEGRPVLVFPLVTNAEPPPPPRPNDNPSSQIPPHSISSQPNGLSAGQPQPMGPRELLQALRPAPPEGMIHVPDLRGWCFLELNTEYLQKQLLPELVARHFSQEALIDYEVAVVTGHPSRIIYQSDPTLTTESLSNVDAGIILFDSHLQPGRPLHPPPPPPEDFPHGEHPRGEPPPPPPPGEPPPFFNGMEGAPPPAQAGNIETEAWQLVLKIRAGSLESLMNQERRRNLALSFGVLLLLAGSSLMLMLATRRARSLARQQMEFVAGVSHELRTPLTVIQSTSYNLSKGMIQDPQRVRKYGMVIQGEARRLINQVERMLSFAGIQSGRKLYDFRSLDVKEIVERALNEYAPAFEEDGWSVEKDFDEELPRVLGDAQSLESAVKNLLENALKYAAQGKWLRVGARAGRSKKGAEIQITVADHGPGIAPSDLPHIFNPFYRGQGVLTSSTGGAGLGLNLVERHLRAHHGHVTVKSSPNDGTAFTLHLPALEPSESAHEERASDDDER
jgi:signal transduction histidine kinase